MTVVGIALKRRGVVRPTEEELEKEEEGKDRVGAVDRRGG